MTEKADQSEKIIAVPHQDAVEVEVTGEEVSVSQRNSSDGNEAVIWVTGAHNIDLLIAVLQEARREIGGEP
jgi:hypothetical protein